MAQGEGGDPPNSQSPQQEVQPEHRLPHGTPVPPPDGATDDEFGGSMELIPDREDMKKALETQTAEMKAMKKQLEEYKQKLESHDVMGGRQQLHALQDELATKEQRHQEELQEQRKANARHLKALSTPKSAMRSKSQESSRRLVRSRSGSVATRVHFDEGVERRSRSPIEQRKSTSRGPSVERNNKRKKNLLMITSNPSVETRIHPIHELPCTCRSFQYEQALIMEDRECIDWEATGYDELHADHWSTFELGPRIIDDGRQTVKDKMYMAESKFMQEVEESIREDVKTDHMMCSRRFAPENHRPNDAGNDVDWKMFRCPGFFQFQTEMLELKSLFCHRMIKTMPFQGFALGKELMDERRVLNVVVTTRGYVWTSALYAQCGDQGEILTFCCAHYRADGYIHLVDHNKKQMAALCQSRRHRFNVLAWSYECVHAGNYQGMEQWRPRLHFQQKRQLLEEQYVNRVPHAMKLMEYMEFRLSQTCRMRWRSLEELIRVWNNMKTINSGQPPPVIRDDARGFYMEYRREGPEHRHEEPPIFGRPAGSREGELPPPPPLQRGEMSEAERSRARREEQMREQGERRWANFGRDHKSWKKYMANHHTYGE